MWIVNPSGKQEKSVKVGNEFLLKTLWWFSGVTDKQKKGRVLVARNFGYKAAEKNSLLVIFIEKTGQFLGFWSNFFFILRSSADSDKSRRRNLDLTFNGKLGILFFSFFLSFSPLKKTPKNGRNKNRGQIWWVRFEPFWCLKKRSEEWMSED